MQQQQTTQAVEGPVSAEEQCFAEIKQLAAKLYSAGLGCIFLPMFSVRPALLLIVGSASELEAMRTKPEAMLDALDHAKALTEWQHLILPLEAALFALGDCSAGMLRVISEAGADLWVVMGTLTEFERLVRSLRDSLH